MVGEQTTSWNALTEARKRRPSYRVAYTVIPDFGGTFTTFLSLREALKPYGGQVYAVTAGKRPADKWNPRAADDSCVAVAPDETDPLRTAQAFVQWCQDAHVDVLVLLTDPLIASAVRHLPPHVRVVSLTVSTSRSKYRFALSLLDRLSRILVICPRQQEDLLRLADVGEPHVVFTPLGLDMVPFDRIPPGTTAAGESLRLGYVGRLDDNAKGVLLLPKIARMLDRQTVRYRLDVIGTGMDEKALRKRLAAAVQGQRVVFHGRQPVARIPCYLAPMELLLMPSYYEGFGQVLVEAMAAGVVPICSRLRGVTDWLVENGRTGMLCEAGRARSFADAVIELNNDRERLGAMSLAGRKAVRERFSLKKMGKRYDKVFRKILAEPAVSCTPKPWSEFETCRVLPPKWRQWIPRQLKQTVRAWCERAGRSV